MRPLILAALITLAQPAAADVTGVVVDVHDGDTLTLRTEAGGDIRVRVAAIDAPELQQPYGEAAHQELARLVGARTVRVIDAGTDRYGRLLGRVFIGPLDVNAELVARGAAWCYVRYLPPGSDCPAREANARAARRGLWALPAPIAPWDWRHATR